MENNSEHLTDKSEVGSTQPASHPTPNSVQELITSGTGPDLHQRLQDMTALHQLSLEIHASLNLDHVLHAIVRSLRSLLANAYAVSIMLVGEGGALEPAAVDSLSPSLSKKDIRLRPGEGLRGQVILLGEAIYSPMVRNDRRYVETDPELQSILILPLIVKSQAIGTLAAESNIPNAFTSYDENLAAIAAIQASNAIENAHIYEREQRRADELNSLMELGRTITQNLDIEQVFATAHQAVKKLMPSDAFYISLRDIASPSSSVTYLIDNGTRYPPARWPIEAGLSGYVLRTGEQVLISDILKEELPFQGIYYGDQEQIRSLIACPLLFQGKLKGMVSSQSYQLGAFSLHDLQLLQSIADHLAVAVQNTEMYTDLHARYLTLQELERVRSEIIQNVSHELRTPLTFVRSYIELLLDEQLGSLNQRQIHSLKIVQSRTNTLVRLVEDIATLETTGPEWLQPAEVNLAELAAKAMQVMEHLARERDDQLILDVIPDFPRVWADPDRINQVLENLLGNALKYGQKASKIVVRLDADADRAIVSVSNMGTSIPTREHERIFERFYQIDGSISRLQTGLGLGLAIVKRIIDAHHGQVWVQSDIESGSTFFFSLPYQSSQEQGQEN